MDFSFKHQGEIFSRLSLSVLMVWTSTQRHILLDFAYQSFVFFMSPLILLPFLCFVLDIVLFLTLLILFFFVTSHSIKIIFFFVFLIKVSFFSCFDSVHLFYRRFFVSLLIKSLMEFFLLRIWTSTQIDLLFYTFFHLYFSLCSNL